MKAFKGFCIVLLVIFTSCVTSQSLSAQNIQVKWTVDIVLGSGYTTTQTFTVDKSNFLICYNSITGKTQIWNLTLGGSPIYDKTTHKGWSSMVFFELNNATYLFTYKESTGEVIFYKMSTTGISSRVGEYTWSKGWNGFDVIYNKYSKPVIIMTRASDGRAKFFEPYF
jgi:hypothetical protein